MAYIRGHKAQIDAWESLGNPGWNWDALLPYALKSENYTIPNDSQLAAGATYDPAFHGFEGPVHTGYQLSLSNGSAAPVIIATWESLLLPHNPDLNGGNTHGFSIGPLTVDAVTNLRSDAASAYYTPIEARPNLRILRGTVKRVVWDKKKKKNNRPGAGKEDLLVATGVEYITDKGEARILSAAKEVILSAGSVRTPLIIEGSGIGNPKYVFLPQRGTARPPYLVTHRMKVASNKRYPDYSKSSASAPRSPSPAWAKTTSTRPAT